MNLTVLNNKTVIFIGGGNMAGALIDGLLKAKTAQNLTLTIAVSDPNEPNRAKFAQKGVVAVSPELAGEQIANADVLVLAVKPQVMGDVCQTLLPFIGNQLIVSVAAGLSLATLQAMTGSNKIVRTMPNLPATVGLGATGLFADKVSDDDKALAQAVMNASGIGVWVDNESDLHTVTAVAGSAPAYFFYVLEQMIDEAVAMGLSYDNAHALAVQTMIGAGTMAKDDNPADLRAKVTSKGGTTHSAITHFIDNGLDTVIKGGMRACVARSTELGK